MAALETTASVFLLLADTPRTQLLVTSLCLAAALLVGAFVIALVHRWRRRSSLAEDLSPSAQLAQFRSLYEKGAISQEEFERLRNLLGAQMREDLGVPAPAPEKPASPPAQHPDEGPKNNGQPSDGNGENVKPA
jgi:hypothetical protein